MNVALVCQTIIEPPVDGKITRDNIKCKITYTAEGRSSWLSGKLCMAEYGYIGWNICSFCPLAKFTNISTTYYYLVRYYYLRENIHRWMWIFILSEISFGSCNLLTFLCHNLFLLHSLATICQGKIDVEKCGQSLNWSLVVNSVKFPCCTLKQ